MRIIFRPHLSAFIVSITITTIICRFSIADSHVDNQVREKAVSTLDALYSRYLTESLPEARISMQKAVAFIDENSCQIPELRSGLPICYARLSFLERTAGNEARSRLYFEKSRYWRIIEREKIGLKPEEIVVDYDAFTREESDKYALEWDKKRTKGAGPAYARITKVK